MPVAYFDCFSGASGDMILGALVDAGLPLARLRRELAKVALPPFRIEKAPGRGFAGVNLGVRAEAEPSCSDYMGLDRLIASSKLEKRVKELSRRILGRLAEAEARVHGVDVSRVHFHEVGAVDSVVDIVGSAVGFDHFGFSEIHCSPLPMSRGSVACEHGELPVPAPATLELLKGVPLERTRVKGELVTPTGAAILTSVVSHFGECPLQRIDRVGAGFGDREIKGRPNLLRLMVGEGFRAVVIEADIDDMSPELYESAVERMFAAGAADVTMTPVQMKKSRPGVRLSCVSPWEAKDRVMDVMLSETTTFGVRYWGVERKMLARELVQGRVVRGGVAFKVGRDPSGRIVKAVPEYESIKKLARARRSPLIHLFNKACADACGLTDQAGKRGKKGL